MTTGRECITISGPINHGEFTKLLHVNYDKLIKTQVFDSFLVLTNLCHFSSWHHQFSFPIDFYGTFLFEKNKEKENSYTYMTRLNDEGKSISIKYNDAKNI